MSLHVIKLLLIGLLYGGLLRLTFYMDSDTISLISVVKFLSFGDFDIGAGGIYLFLQKYFPLLIFQALWGTYIYKHFCTASVYFFTRIEKRCKWYLKEVVKLFLSTLSFVVVLSASFIICISIKNNIAVDETGILVWVYYIVMQTLWLYAMTLLTNVFSICWGSCAGYLTVTGMTLAFVCYYVVFESVLDFSNQEDMVLKTILLKINPLSHLVLKWHSSEMENLNAYINELRIEFSMGSSLWLLLIMVGIVLVLGNCVVKRQEFIVVNREVGGIV